MNSREFAADNRAVSSSNRSRSGVASAGAMLKPAPSRAQRELISDNGDFEGSLIHQTPGNLFAGTSSAAFGKGDFSAYDLIVTEKGLPFIDMTSNFGNKVSSYDLSALR